ncbi:MAG: hypothetical protein HY791_11165 [Deltaproteobacteria bacterium]|nr:hypothetical protein [Deltaproteobacteria bacterium]
MSRAGTFATLVGGLFTTSVGQASTTAASLESSPWRGSTLTYEHVASAISASRSAEPTYNPYYAHQLSIRASYHFSELFGASAELGVSQELTDADDTTSKHEALLDDVVLRGTLGGISLAGLELSASLSLALPFSKASAAESRIVAVSPALQVTKSFDVASGLELSLRTRATIFTHRYTTLQLDVPWARCDDDSFECGSYRHTGDRNPASQLDLGGGVDLQVTEELGFSASYQVRRTQLYAIHEARVQTLTGPAQTSDARDDVSARYSHTFALDGTYSVSKELGVTLGLVTAHPQLKPDSTYRVPLFNRFTQLSLDLTVSLDEVASRLGG